MRYLLLILTCGSLQGAFNISDTSWPYVNPCDTGVYLINQNFEGTDYDYCEVWTLGGTGLSFTNWIDPNYTSLALEATESLWVHPTNSIASATSPVFAGQDEVWVYFQMRPRIFHANYHIILSIRTAADALVCNVYVDPAARLYIEFGGSAQQTVSSFSLNTTYHVWIRNVKGTGANQIVSGAFSTDGIRPTSGNQFTQFTNGGSTDQVGMVRFGAIANLTTADYIFDKIRVDNAVIGDNPP